MNQSKQFTIDLNKAGIPVVATYPVAPTATNFRAQAQDMKQKGVDLIYTIAEVNAIANLARAFGDVGYFPKVPFYGAQTYGHKFLQLAGPSAEGAIAAFIFHIPEDVGTNPAMATFNTWYARTAPGADVDFFSIVSWVAGEMLVKALRHGRPGPDPGQGRRRPQDVHQLLVRLRGADQPRRQEAVAVLRGGAGEGREVAEDLPGRRRLPVLTDGPC